MTIDKIKHYMGERMFNHWGAVTDTAKIRSAKETLETEIEAGLLSGIQYVAELYLLRHLLGEPQQQGSKI